MTTNTTCDVYRNGSAPPATPDVAGVACLLSADYWRRLQDGAGDGSSYQFTHVLLVAADADIRDGMINFSFNAAQNDDVYIPDQNGTRFRVVAVEIHARSQSGPVRRVYLDRYAPAWPSNYL